MRLAVLAAILLLALPASARAQDLDAAVQALSTGYVYVDPAAEAAGDIDAGALEEQIRGTGESIFVAVLPARAAEGATVDQTLRALHDQAGVNGTYALVLGDEFRAGSDTSTLDAPVNATAALRDHPGDIEATLEDFVDRIDSEAGGGSGTGLWWLLGVLPFLFFGVVFTLVIVFVVRANSRSRAKELDEVKRNVRDDLVALAEDIRAVELDMQMPGANAEAKRAYASAVEAYERANQVWETAGSTRDLKGAAEALDEGRYAMIWAREVLAGRTPPERRSPCFFDPRHGPSSRDVTWAPSGGTPRPVPACEADAQRVDRGEDPNARYVDHKGRHVPIWEAGPAYAPFYSGFFPGLLIGSMVSGGWDNPTPSDYSGSSTFGGGGGGDFGGGGGGGGGGDFGGGSF